MLNHDFSFSGGGGGFAVFLDPDPHSETRRAFIKIIDLIQYPKTLAAGDFLSDGEDNLRLRPGLDVHLLLQQMAEIIAQQQQLPVPRTYNIQVKVGTKRLIT